jgi:hypothetical protein
MVLIPLKRFNDNPGHIINPSPSHRSPPSIQQIKRIYRKPEEPTPVNVFRRFSGANPEPKGVKYLDHRLSGPSQVAYHSLSGSFPAVESMWVAPRVHDLSSRRALLLAVNGNADLKPFKTILNQFRDRPARAFQDYLLASFSFHKQVRINKNVVESPIFINLIDF